LANHQHDTFAGEQLRRSGRTAKQQHFQHDKCGGFGIDWLGYDNWVEGTGGGMGSPGYPNNSSVSFDSIPTLFSAGSDSLGAFNYTLQEITFISIIHCPWTLI